MVEKEKPQEPFARAKELGNKACDFYCDWYANGKASDAGFAAYELVSWVREMLVEIDKSEAAVAALQAKAALADRMAKRVKTIHHVCPMLESRQECVVCDWVAEYDALSGRGKGEGKI